MNDTEFIILSISVCSLVISLWFAVIVRLTVLDFRKHQKVQIDSLGKLIHYVDVLRADS